MSPPILVLPMLTYDSITVSFYVGVDISIYALLTGGRS